MCLKAWTRTRSEMEFKVPQKQTLGRMELRLRAVNPEIPACGKKNVDSE